MADKNIVLKLFSSMQDRYRIPPQEPGLFLFIRPLPMYSTMRRKGKISLLFVNRALFMAALLTRLRMYWKRDWLPWKEVLQAWQWPAVPQQ